MDSPPKIGFARIPIEVLTDEKLTPTDKCVYAGLSMHAVISNLVYVGQRRLAEMLSLDRRTMRRSLDRLAKRGHLSRSIHKMGQRTCYQLNSPMFVTERGAKEIWLLAKQHSKEIQ